MLRNWFTNPDQSLEKRELAIQSDSDLLDFRDSELQSPFYLNSTINSEDPKIAAVSDKLHKRLSKLFDDKAIPH